MECTKREATRATTTEPNVAQERRESPGSSVCPSLVPPLSSLSYGAVARVLARAYPRSLRRLLSLPISERTGASSIAAKSSVPVAGKLALRVHARTLYFHAFLVSSQKNEPHASIALRISFFIKCSVNPHPLCPHEALSDCISSACELVRLCFCLQLLCVAIEIEKCWNAEKR